ncbi:MAG: YceI family protein [Pseudomonadota bacterium]
MKIWQGVISASALLISTACAAENGAEVAEEAAGTAVETSAAASQPSEPSAGVDLSGAPTGAYKADSGHRYITFTYDHQGFSAPFLRWRDWDATLDWNAEDPSASSVSVTIDAASIDSGVDAFDNHLKSGDFFDVENYPTITFVSTGIETTGPNTGKITGDLTIKDVTKPVVVDAKFNKGAFNERAKAHKIGFSGKANVLRSDFDVDLAVPFVGDEVSLIIEVEFDEEKPAE